MNTKFILLLAAFLLIATRTSSVLNTKSEVSITESTSMIVTTDESPSSSQTETVPFPEPVKAPTHVDKTHKPNSDDDGKHHHFHFSRVGVSRRRFLAVVTFKVLLFVVHVASFLFCFHHATHMHIHF